MEAYTRLFSVFTGIYSEGLFICEEHEIDFVFWQPSRVLGHFCLRNVK